MTLPDSSAAWRDRMWLAPLTPSPRESSEAVAYPVLRREHHETVRLVVRMCALVLAGSRPMSALRPHAERAAFGQFTRLCRSLRQAAVPPRLRLNRTVIDGRGDLDVVVTVEQAARVRVLALRVRRFAGGWRMTQCQLVD